MERYDPQAIEAKWQRIWEDVRAFYTPNPAPGEETEASNRMAWSGHTSCFV